MTADIRTAARGEAFKNHYSHKHVRDRYDADLLMTGFMDGAVWAASRVTPTREQIAEARKYAKKKRGNGWIEMADTVDRLSNTLEAVTRERDAALARIAEAAKLHRKYTYYDLEDSCPDTTDEHREEHHHESDEIGEFYCDQMPTGDVCCDTCRDVNGDRMDWPCATVAALGLNEGESE